MITQQTKNIISLVTLILIFQLFVFPAQAEQITLPQIDKLPKHNLKTDWYHYTLQNKKLGYSSISMYYVMVNNHKIYVFEETIFVKVLRGDQVSTSTSFYRAFENEHLRPIGFWSKNSQSEQPITTKGKVSGDKLIVIKESMGGVSRKVIDDFKDVLFPSAVHYKLLSAKIKTGTQHKFKIFFPSLLKVTQATFRIKDQEIIKYNKKKVQAYRLEVDNNLYRYMRSVSWISEKGKTYKETYPEVGVTLVKDAKKAVLKQETTPEVFVSSFIKSNIRLSNSMTLRKLKLKITIKDTDIKDILPANEQQTLDIINKNTAIVDINTKLILPKKILPIPIKEKSLEKYLTENEYLQCKDELIVKKAREIIKDEKNSWQAAKKLNYWVFKNINKKDLSVGFGSAKETIISRSGDCTEHSVLLAALSRAVGIPSRVVIGLVYFNGVFGYHMWVEVYVGKWIPLDPALGQSIIDATHIKINHTDLSEETTTVSVKLLKIISKVKIEVLPDDL